MQPSLVRTWIKAVSLTGMNCGCNTVRSEFQPSLDEVDEGAQGCRHVAAARIIEEGSGEGLLPILQHGLQRAACQLLRQELPEGGDQPEPLNRGRDLQIDIVGDHPGRGADLYDLVVAL